MGGLKDELLKAIWHAFTALDLDRSGKVSKSQLKVGSAAGASRGRGGGERDGTRGGVRREGWWGTRRGGGPHASFWPRDMAQGRARSSGPATAETGALAGPPRDAPGVPLTGCRGARAPPRPAPADLGASESACRAARILLALSAKAIAFAESSSGLPEDPRV